LFTEVNSASSPYTAQLRLAASEEEEERLSQVSSVLWLLALVLLLLLWLQPSQLSAGEARTLLGGVLEATGGVARRSSSRNLRQQQVYHTEGAGVNLKSMFTLRICLSWITGAGAIPSKTNKKYKIKWKSTVLGQNITYWFLHIYVQV
jgi:hypothetical protein